MEIGLEVDAQKTASTTNSRHKDRFWGAASPLCVLIQYKVCKGSQNTTLDIFIAQWLKQATICFGLSNGHHQVVQYLVYNNYTICKAAVWFDDKILITITIHRSNLVYVIMYILGNYKLLRHKVDQQRLWVCPCHVACLYLQPSKGRNM
jgi:hypothetical protein